ncbi:MAG: hypothetical protein IPG66_00245 [Hydrogenophilales bacterium]|nr:hypothetical protein [Hydrogenophilales bacterium]
MNWKDRLALIFWRLTPAIALFSSAALLVLPIPPEYLRNILLPVFPSMQYFLFFGGITLAFTATFLFMLFVAVGAWVILFRKFIGVARVLQVVRSASKEQSPARQICQYIIGQLDART